MTLPVVAFILGTSEPDVVAAAMTTAVSNAAGAAMIDARFYEPGVGIVVGLDPEDGRKQTRALRWWMRQPQRLSDTALADRLQSGMV